MTNDWEKVYAEGPVQMQASRFLLWWQVVAYRQRPLMSETTRGVRRPLVSGFGLTPWSAAARARLRLESRERRLILRHQINDALSEVESVDGEAP